MENRFSPHDVEATRREVCQLNRRADELDLVRYAVDAAPLERGIDRALRDVDASDAGAEFREHGGVFALATPHFQHALPFEVANYPIPVLRAEVAAAKHAVPTQCFRRHRLEICRLRLTVEELAFSLPAFVVGDR